MDESRNLSDEQKLELLTRNLTGKPWQDDWNLVPQGTELCGREYLIAQHCNNRDFMLNNLLNRIKAFPKINTGNMDKLTAFNIHAQQLRPSWSTSTGKNCRTLGTVLETALGTTPGPEIQWQSQQSLSPTKRTKTTIKKSSPKPTGKPRTNSRSNTPN